MRNTLAVSPSMSDLRWSLSDDVVRVSKISSELRLRLQNSCRLAYTRASTFTVFRYCILSCTRTTAQTHTHSNTTPQHSTAER